MFFRWYFVTFTVKVTRADGEEGDVLLPSGGRAEHGHVISLCCVLLTEKTQIWRDYYCKVKTFNRFGLQICLHLYRILSLCLIYPLLPLSPHYSHYCSSHPLFPIVPTQSFSWAAGCGKGCWNAPCWKHRSQTCGSTFCLSLGSLVDLHDGSTGKSDIWVLYGENK